MAASQADLDALRAFAAGGTNARVTDAQATRYQRIYETAQSRAGAEEAVGNAQRAQARAAGQRQANAINAQREADRQADRQARDQQQADERRRRTEERNAKTARAPFDALSAWVEGLPTPGGNLALLLIILFFAFAIIPVNGGATRLELIYLVLTGRADLPTNAAGTSGNTTTTTPGIGQIVSGIGAGVGGVVAGVGTGIGLPPGILPGASSASGGGPGSAAPTAQAMVEYLAPARMGADW